MKHDQTALLYDCALPRNIAFEMKQQICSFIRPSSKVFRFDVMNTMAQPNWRASEASETLSGLFNRESYIIIYI